MLKITESVIVTKGNYPLFPAGQPVFTVPTGKKSVTINVLPGQLVIFDPKTGLSLPNTTTVETHPEIEIAVGIGEGGVTRYLRGSSGKKIVGCSISAINAKAPRCGTPAVQDLLFSCVDANEPYSVKITAWDTEIRSTFDYNRPAEFIFTREVVAGGCADCTSQDYSRKLACELVDAINGKQPAGWKVEKNGRFIDPVELPFTGSVLYSQSQVFCLATAVAEECESCNVVAALTGIQIGEGDPITFTNAVDPRDSERTLTAQLAGIVDQINKALSGNGNATLVSSGAPCCPYAIEINTCLEGVVLLDGEGNPLAPCDEAYNPLEVPADANTCKNCEEDENGTLTYPAGIRITGRPVDVQTGCYIPDPGNTNIARQVAIYPFNGFESGTWRVVDVQAASNATQQGFQLIHREYRQDLAGPGRDFRPDNTRTSRYGLPIKGDRLTSTLTDQYRAYCVYNIEHSIPNTSTSYHGDKSGPKLRTKIHVPSGDTVTTAALNTWLNNYGTSAPCKAPVNVSCA